MKLLTKLYDYQWEDVDRICDYKGRCLLANEMGTGKSLTSLVFLSQNPEAFPAVVVCPAGLRWNWQREALIHLNMRSTVLDTTRPDKGNLIGADANLFIVGYEILAPGRAENRGKGWLEWLRNRKPRTVIVDECQKIASKKAQRSKAVRKLCEGVPHFIALSGTPLTNRPAELFNVLNLLRPDLYPSWWEFAQAHCKPERKPWGWVFNGAENLDVLHRNLLRNCMIRRRKADVLKDLPEKSRHVVLIDIKDRKEYNHAYSSFLDWLKGQKGVNLKKASKAEQLVKIGYLKRLIAKLKHDAVCEWLDEFLAETDEKLIHFAVHRKVIARLHERYRNQCVVVDGSVIGRNRQKAIDQFTHDKRCRLLIGNIEAAGVGWNGTAASTVSFGELGWTPGGHSQAEARIERIGQKRKMRAVYLIARNTIEEKLAELIQKKQRTLDQTLDGHTNGAATLDVFDELMRQMEEEI